MKMLPHTHGCFVCGESNAIGLKLRFETDGRIVQTQFVPRPEHVGFRNTVHGGLITSLLDEVMVWACAVNTKCFSFCAELNVRFLNQVQPGDPTRAIGSLITNRRNRIFEAQAALSNDNGLVFATATGKYLPIKHADMTGMLTDVVGDLRTLFEGVEPNPGGKE